MKMLYSCVGDNYVFSCSAFKLCQADIGYINVKRQCAVTSIDFYWLSKGIVKITEMVRVRLKS